MSKPPDFDKDGEAFSDFDDENDFLDEDLLSIPNTRATLSTRQEWTAPAKQEWTAVAPAKQELTATAPSLLE